MLAIDTESKRRSAAYVMPVPHGFIDKMDRKHMCSIYRGPGVLGIVELEASVLGIFFGEASPELAKYIRSPNQYSILETFSPNTVSNIRNIVRVITGVTADISIEIDSERNRRSIAYILPDSDTIIDENDRQQVACVYADIFKLGVGALSHPISLKNGKVPDRSHFQITNIGTTITISSGIAIVCGTYIETTDSLSLDITNLNNSYVFASSGDMLPGINGTHYLYVILYHHSTETDQLSYFGLINNYNFYEQYKDYICRLGILKITVAGGVIVSIDEILEEHPSISGRGIDYINIPGRTCAILDGGIL